MQDKIKKTQQKNSGFSAEKLITGLICSAVSIMLGSLGTESVNLNVSFAFAACMILAGGQSQFIILLTVLSGYFYEGIVGIFVSCICAVVTMVARMIFRKMSFRGCAAVVVSANIISAFLARKFFYLPDSYMFGGILSAVAGIFLCAVFVPCAGIITGGGNRFMTRTERLCLLIFGSLLTVSAYSITLFYTSLGEIVAFTAIMLLGKYFREECLAYAFLVFIFSYVFINAGKDMAVILSCTGFFSIFSSAYCAHIACFVCMGGILAVCALTAIPIGGYIPGIVISSGIYCICVNCFGRYFLMAGNTEIKKKELVDESMALVLDGELSLQKNALRAIISGISEDSSEDDICKIICRECIGSVCMECEKYQECWFEKGEETYSTFRYYIKLMQDNLPGSFIGADCTPSRGDKIRECVNYSLMNINNRAEYKRKASDFLKIYSSQTDHLCGVMDRIGNTLMRNLGFYDELSSEVCSLLRNNGSCVTDVMINDDFAGRMKAVIRTHSPAGENTLRRLVPEALKECTGKKFAYSFYRESIHDGSCMYLYEEEYAFSLKAAYSSVTKDGESKCGDSMVSEDMGNIHLVAVCDGMGSGESAQTQSRKVTNMLHRLIAAGYAYEDAVEFINSVLVFSQRNEVFTTLDMFVFDKKTSEGIFFKAGAESSFVKRGRELIKIKSETLPVGILEHTLGNAVKVPLKKGDYIYLMSDGIISSFNYDEQALAGVINSMDYRSPQKLADELIRLAVSFTSGRAKDDMTVIVCKVR